MTPKDPLSSPGYRWRRIRAWAFNALAVCIIGLAILVGLARLLVPHVDQIQPQLEAWLSEQAGAEVQIQGIEVAWPGLLPSIAVEGLRIGEDETKALDIDAALVEFRLLNVFRANQALTNVVLLGPRVVFTEQPDGQWQVALTRLVGTKEDARSKGFDLEGSSDGVSGGLPAWLGLSIRQAELVLQPLDGAQLELHIAEAGLSQAGNQTRLSGWLSAAPNAPEQVQFRLWMAQQQGQWRAGQAWLNAKQIALDYWLAEIGFGDVVDTKTVVSLEAWATWNKEEGAKLDAEWLVAGEHGLLEGQGSVVRRPVAVGQRAWSVELYELLFDDQIIVDSLAFATDDKAQALGVAFADLDAMHRALDPWLSRLDLWPEQIAGQIDRLMLGFDLEYRVHHATGSIDQFAFGGGAGDFRIFDFNVSVEPDGDRLALVLHGSPTVVWPGALDEPLSLNAISGRVLASMDQLSFDAIAIEAPFVNAHLFGNIYRNDGRPFVDLLIDRVEIESVDVRPFLPEAIIPPPAMRWLDESLRFVGDVKGNALLHHPIGLAARDFGPGHLSSHLDFDGVELAYLNGWPVATEMAGQVSFLGTGLEATVDQAMVNGMVLQAPSLAIESFFDLVLDLSLSASKVDANALADTLGEIPLSGFETTFSAMEWANALDASVDLHIPIRKMEEFSITGEVLLEGNGLQFPAANVALDDVSGALLIDQGRLFATGLRTRFQDQVLSWEVDGRLGTDASVSATTQLDVGAVLAEMPQAQGMGQWFGGRTDLSVRVGKDALQQTLVVDMESSLEGLSIGLPAPFNKSAEEVRPLRLRWFDQAKGGEWQVWWDSLGTAVVRADEQGWALAVDAGSMSLPIAPIAPGLELTGTWPALDVGAWQTIWTTARDRLGEDVSRDSSSDSSSESSDTPSGEGSMDVSIDRYFGGRIFAELSTDQLLLPGVKPGSAKLDLSWEQDQWSLNVIGESIEGQVNAPASMAKGRPWVVDLSHLYLLTTPTDAEESPIPPPNPSDPRQVAPITLLIDSLYWGDLALGTTRLETHRSGDGLEIELVDIDGPDLRLQARGRWVRTDDAVPITSMSGRLSSRNFNQLIRATGYQAGLQARQASLDFDLDWPGTPVDFNLLRLTGGLDFEMRDGNIPQASAGAGRLLGLVSLNALPRRLMLDFRDVFASGFPFDRLTGQFEMIDGTAKTEGVRIASPAAVITFSGTTDMIAKSYDQTLLVEPGLGSTLPVIGGLAGGPVGAAAGLLLQSIFNQPLKGVSEARYSITGPWSEPQIELVDAKVSPVEEQTPVVPEQPLEQSPQPPPNP